MELVTRKRVVFYWSNGNRTCFAKGWCVKENRENGDRNFRKLNARVWLPQLWPRYPFSSVSAGSYRFHLFCFSFSEQLSLLPWWLVSWKLRFFSFFLFILFLFVVFCFFKSEKLYLVPDTPPWLKVVPLPTRFLMNSMWRVKTIKSQEWLQGLGLKYYKHEVAIETGKTPERRAFRGSVILYLQLSNLATDSNYLVSCLQNSWGPPKNTAETL